MSSTFDCAAGYDCGMVNCKSPIVLALLNLPCPPGYVCPVNSSISACDGGKYCPDASMNSQLHCPSGHFCPPATVRPYSCDDLSICPADSDKQISLLGIVLIVSCCILVYVVLRFISRLGRVNTSPKKDNGQLSSTHPPSSKNDEKKSLLASQNESQSFNTFGDARPPQEQQHVSISVATSFQGYSETQDVTDTVASPVGRRRIAHPESIVFQDVCYRVKKRMILDRVSGMVRPGRLTAILGPSGAGKTTLLHILTRKLSASSGQVSCTRGAIGFVPQDDIMLSQLTVRETLLHSARTRCKPQRRKDGESASNRDEYLNSIVDEVLDVLGLTHVQHSVVGDEYTRGVSGGEKKRVSVGMELVANTPLLALDEPTSGLDAAAATQVVGCLRDIVRLRATTVFAVVHQPRYEVFNMFDDVILLGRGGRMVYCGSRDGVLGYFEARGFICPQRVNPPDFLLDTLSALDFKGSQNPLNFSSSHLNASVNGQSSVALSPSAGSQITSFDSDAERFSTTERSLPQDALLLKEFKQQQSREKQSTRSKQVVSFWLQLIPYIKRAFVCHARNLRGVLLAAIMHAVAGALLGVSYADDDLFRPPLPAVYYGANLCPEPVKDWFCARPVRDQVGILGGYMIMGVGLVGIAVACSTFGEERLVYFREVSSGQSPLAYFIGKILADVPLIGAYSLLYISAMYSLMSPEGSFWNYYAVAACLEFTVFGVTYVISLLVKRENAALVALVICSVWATTSGVAVTISDMGIAGTLSYPRWAGEAIFVTEVRLDHMSQGQADAVKYYVENFMYGYNMDEFGKDLGMLVMFGCAFRVIAFVAMRLVDRSKQK